MIGATPGRVAAVIGGDDQQIVRFQTLAKLRQAAIEFLQRKRITGGIAAMTIDRIEIDEVGKQQPAVLQTVDAFKGAVEQRVVAGCLQDFAGSGTAKNIR